MAGNYKIDNEKFGAFLSRLRKEKGMTQKELAEKLYVSDKAVSKWERGLSLPDIALLQPLAALMEVSVTEMLCGEIIRKDQPLTVQEIEPLINGALVMTAQEQTAQRDSGGSGECGFCGRWRCAPWRPGFFTGLRRRGS